MNMNLKKFIALSTILLSSTCYAANSCKKQLKVAVIDSGLDLNDIRFKDHLCKTGHKNFVENESISDILGHGSHVTGLIQEYAKDSNYCLMIYKYYNQTDPGIVTMKHEKMALQEAVDNGADIVNLSGGGPVFDEQEYLIIKDNSNVLFVVSAGNDHEDLDNPDNEFYPASYLIKNGLKNIVPVKNVDSEGKLELHSNYAKEITAQEIGINVLSYLPNMKMGRLTGTSMSCAIHTGKIIDTLSKTCQYRKK
jgi:subtilisin family serine protease